LEHAFEIAPNERFGGSNPAVTAPRDSRQERQREFRCSLS